MNIPNLSLSTANQPLSGVEAALQGADDVVQEVLNQTTADAATGDVSATTGPTVIGSQTDDNWMEQALAFTVGNGAAQGAPSRAPTGMTSPLVMYGATALIIGVGGYFIWRAVRNRGG